MAGIGVNDSHIGHYLSSSLYVFFHYRYHRFDYGVQEIWPGTYVSISGNTLSWKQFTLHDMDLTLVRKEHNSYLIAAV